MSIFDSIAQVFSGLGQQTNTSGLSFADNLGSLWRNRNYDPYAGLLIQPYGLNYGPVARDPYATGLTSIFNYASGRTEDLNKALKTFYDRLPDRNNNVADTFNSLKGNQKSIWEAYAFTHPGTTMASIYQIATGRLGPARTDNSSYLRMFGQTFGAPTTYPWQFPYYNV